jgi:hypothetical protein
MEQLGIFRSVRHLEYWNSFRLSTEACEAPSYRTVSIKLGGKFGLNKNKLKSVIRKITSLSHLKKNLYTSCDYLVIPRVVGAETLA